MKISVLTVSKRQGWEKIAEESLARQTFQDFEWVIVPEEKVTITRENSLIVPAPPKVRHSNLNASNNAGLKQCKGEYIVFYQDFIDLPGNTLENLLKAAEETGGFITTATVNPDGNHDDRYTGVDTIREIEPPQWEENVGLAPMKALRELGGYDEEYDDGWAWNNVGVAERAAMLGYKFYIEESVKPKLHFHVKEPDADPTIELNYLLHEQKMRYIEIGQAPIKLDYL